MGFLSEGENADALRTPRSFRMPNPRPSMFGRGPNGSLLLACFALRSAIRPTSLKASLCQLCFHG